VDVTTPNVPQKTLRYLQENALALLALAVSIVTLVFGTYGKPEDLRATVYRPTTQLIGLDNDYLNGPLLAEGSGHEVPLEKAKSYKLMLKGHFVFVNAGSEPILISEVDLVDLYKGLKVCKGAQSYTATKWDEPPFVLKPGEIIAKDNITFHLRYTLALPEVLHTCFEFVTIDRTGEEQKFMGQGFQIWPRYPDVDLKSVNIEEFARNQITYTVLRTWF
jgi:hypothetical protein